jgi:hypothetical protein
MYVGNMLLLKTDNITFSDNSFFINGFVILVIISMKGTVFIVWIPFRRAGNPS